MRILISAGEASGDMYGAQLIEALRRAAEQSSAGRSAAQDGASPVSTHGQCPEDRGARLSTTLEFFGAGGERMRAAGCEIVVDAKDLAVVGITEVVSRLPKILGLYKKLIRAADERRPDVAVVIDSPAFNWRVARQMRNRGVPVVYYVCPQFWAWRQGRVKLLRKYIDKALVIFPFEEKFYGDRGVDAMFVGHPLANLPMPTISREEYAKENAKDFRLDPAKPWITLMPGSRMKEVRMNLPTIVDAALLLGKDYEYLLPVAPTLDRELLESDLYRRAMAAGEIELPVIHFVPEAVPALRHSRAAIVASGTATVEAALMETPFVMVYRVSRLTYALGKPRVKVPYFAMVNLIAGEEVVPELVQHKFTAANIVAELRKIIPDGSARESMIRGLQSVREKLRKPGSGEAGHAPEQATDDVVPHAADRAAKIILEMIG